MSNSNHTGVLLGGILLGAAIGGAIGILFAPDKGAETRKKIVGKSDELTDAVKEKFNDFLDGIKQEVQSVTDKANDALEQGIAKAEKIRNI